MISKTAAYSFFNKMSLMMAKFEFNSSRPWLTMVDTNFKSIFMCLWMSFNTLFSVLKNFKTKYLFHFAISPFRYFAISLIIISLAIQHNNSKTTCIFKFFNKGFALYTTHSLVIPCGPLLSVFPELSLPILFCFVF